MAKSKGREFTVNAWLTVFASVTISAESLQDAAEQSLKLQATDFLDFKGEFIDGREVRVSWITDESAEPK